MSVRSIRFNLELFPFHSPLLRESLLVSFPPLINMLKFSGSSHLIRVKEPLKDLNILICPPSLEYFCFESKFVFREALQLCGGSFQHALNPNDIERHLPSRASWVCDQYQPRPPEHFPSQGQGPNLKHESLRLGSFREEQWQDSEFLSQSTTKSVNAMPKQQKRTSALISQKNLVLEAKIFTF